MAEDLLLRQLRFSFDLNHFIETTLIGVVSQAEIHLLYLDQIVQLDQPSVTKW